MIYLDDLEPTDFRGCGKLGTHGENCDGSRNIGIAVPAHSLCTAPNANDFASVSYHLEGKFTTFRATATLAHQSATPLTFAVLGDGKPLWQTEPINFGTPRKCEVRVKDFKTLTLRVSCRGWNGWAWAYWVDPMLTNRKGIGVAKAIKEEIALPKPGKDGWIVVFRSSDPSIWNSDVNKGQDDFAISLAKVPDNIKYLRMRVAGKDEVIVPVEKAKLSIQSDNGRYGWNGENRKEWNAHHLGIYCPQNHGQKGDISIIAVQNIVAKGCGFGSRGWIGDVQGYSWLGVPIPQTVFEISVKSKSLTKAEQKFLLQ